MELKPGYKQTEVGVIPNEWDVKRLKEISPSQSVGLVINPSTYFEANGEVPMLVGSCISENKINAEKASRISSKNSERLSACRLKTGDLVTVRVGSPGTTAVVPTELDGCNCASMMIIRSHKSFDSYWLAQLLNSPIGRAQIENVEYGTAQKQFNISDAIDFIFPVPPPAEQSKIAEAAKSFDEYIESLEQKIDKKRGIKQAAMQELLTGKRRLPGFEGEWEVRELGSLGTWRGGMTPSMQNTDYWNQGDFPWISSGDVKISRLSDTSQHVTAHAVSSGAAVVIPAKSIVLVTRSGILRKQLPVALLERPMAINQDIKALIPARDTDSSYLLHALTWAGSQILKSCMKTGTTVESVEFAWLKRFTIPVPSHDEQIAIAKALSDMESELAEMEAQRAKAIALKQGMMQQLLTGKIRLR